MGKGVVTFLLVIFGCCLLCNKEGTRNRKEGGRREAGASRVSLLLLSCVVDCGICFCKGGMGAEMD